MKNNLLNKLLSLTLLIMGGAFLNPAWGETYEQLTSIASIDESAEYVLGIDGTGFHYSGTSSWGLTALPPAQTPLKYTLKKADDGNSFTAKTTISGTVYYLQVPTSNTFSMATKTGTNTDLIIGTTQVTETNYAVANKTTATRHLRINGTSGLRSYAGTTGNMAYFYKIVTPTTCATPTFSPVAGAVAYGTEVSLYCATDGATIYYTIDGSNPTSTSAIYSSAIAITADKTIKAIAVKDGLSNSEVATATYTIATPCATPTFSVPAGTYTSDQSVTISTATDDAKIYYTTNGETPTSFSTLYSSAITVSKSMIIKAIAMKDGMANSEVASVNYTINKPIENETITFSELGYANGSTISAVEGEACTIIFSKASGSNDPKYYTDGSAVRAYAKNTFTVSSASKTIKEILLTFGSGDGSNTISTNVGNYTDGTWTGSTSSVTFTIGGSTGNRRISSIKVTYDNRAESDLTKTGDVTLDFNGDNTDADLTDYFTSTSTGAYTYTVADETVIENDDELISALKVGTTTVTVSQAADATYKAGEITINVTVNDTRTACVTGLGLASAKAILKGDTGDLSANATKDASFTGTINYTYASANEEIFYIDDTEYRGAGVGATTVTVTATPTGGNAANYKPVSAVVDVTVNGTNSISLDLTSKSQKYTAGAFTLNATVPTENYNGIVTAESSNTAVATVSVKGTTVTVTPVAIGSANITVTAGTDTYYLTTASESCSVTITAPEGSEDAATGIKTTFDDKDLNYSGTGMNWTASISANSFESSSQARGVQFGAAIGKFTLTSSADNVTKVSMVLSTNGTGNTVGVSVGGNNFSTTYEGIDATETLTLTNGMSKQTVDFTGTGSGTITISVNDANKSVYVRSIAVTTTISKTLNSFGYATFCSEYPLDFTGYATADYSAWEITNISESEGVYTLTFNQLTGTIKGGQGILLKGEAGATVTIPSTSSKNVLSSNLLKGTLAPTYVTAGEYYGLFGQNFVPVAASTVPDGKALLPASALGGGSVKAFNFVFEDNATGIRTVETVSPEEAAQIFDLSGRRLNKIQKGINIVNGKKVLY